MSSSLNRDRSTRVRIHKFPEERGSRKESTQHGSGSSARSSEAAQGRRPRLAPPPVEEPVKAHGPNIFQIVLIAIFALIMAGFSIAFYLSGKGSNTPIDSPRQIKPGEIELGTSAPSSIAAGREGEVRSEAVAPADAGAGASEPRGIAGDSQDRPLARFPSDYGVDVSPASIRRSSGGVNAPIPAEGSAIQTRGGFQGAVPDPRLSGERGFGVPDAAEAAKRPDSSSPRAWLDSTGIAPGPSSREMQTSTTAPEPPKVKSIEDDLRKVVGE